MEGEPDPPPSIPNWVVIEPQICSKDLASYRRYGVASAKVHASNGEFLRVSFELSVPPGVSRLFLHCPEEHEMCWLDTVVAAHDNAVLFRLEIDYEGLSPLASYAVDYFVYSAGGAGAHPSGGPELSLVPRCYPTDDEFYAAGEGSWVRASPWRMRNAQAIGLLRTGERGFVVAELYPHAAVVDDENDEPLSADLFRLRSDGGATGTAASGEWEVTLITTAGAGKGTRGDVCWWETHKVVPFGTHLCWVDLYRGVILCDVNNENPNLHYIRLPLEVASPNHYHTGWPHASRTVFLTGCDEMKFVSIVRTNGMLSGASKPGSSFTITIWTLRQTYDGLEWVKDDVIAADQLWAMEGYDDHLLPRIAPQFPLLSMDNPQIIHFVLREKDTFDADTNICLVTVDMVSKKVLSYEDNKAILSEELDETVSYSLFFNALFFPSEFPKFLKKPTSR